MRDGKRKPVDDVMKEAEEERREREADGTWDGQYHLSVFAGPLEQNEEPEQAVTRLFAGRRRVKWFRTGPVERFQEAGFQLSASEPEPYHYDVLIGSDLTPKVIERFEGCLENEARKNPAWRASR